ncbi:hypothetical protein I4U23_022588 [Adineta vaga]|nr:hypothetical protein I4U23_022588 [Adineta vaga]
MGNTESTLKEEDERIIQRPQHDEGSEFYRACRYGDVQRVKELLPFIPYEDLNKPEPNGSTPLHAASSNGELEIVRLLLHERGCRRNHINRHGLTAYDEALSDEMRQLFHRPDEKNRFCQEEVATENMFIVTTDEEYSELEAFSADKWLQGHNGSEAVDKVKLQVAMIKGFAQFKFLTLVGNYTSLESAFSDRSLLRDLNKLLDEHVKDGHREFEHCKALVADTFKEHKPEHLLRLYTLETPFYDALSNHSDIMSMPLALSLDKLKPRYFQGISYRGLKMTEENLRTYQWALKSNGAIRTRTFCSTTLKQSVAERYAAKSRSSDGKRSVLMILTFPEKCDTAINLGKLSSKLPCLSAYENEAEILVTPFTLFVVTQIESNANYMTVHLENIPVRPLSTWGILKTIYNEVKEQMNSDSTSLSQKKSKSLFSGLALETESNTNIAL